MSVVLPLERHYDPTDFRDRIAYAFVEFLRFFADTFLLAGTAIARWCWKRLLPCRAWWAAPCNICVPCVAWKAIAAGFAP